MPKPNQSRQINLSAVSQINKIGTLLGIDIPDDPDLGEHALLTGLAALSMHIERCTIHLPATEAIWNADDVMTDISFLLDEISTQDSPATTVAFLETELHARRSTPHVVAER